MNKIVKIEKLSDEKFLNLYAVEYDSGIRWTFASRQKDPFKIAQKLATNGEEYVIVTKQKDGQKQQYVQMLQTGHIFQNVDDELVFCQKVSPSTSQEADAINVLPYVKNPDGTMSVVLAMEFRYPINGWVLSTPAGLVENGMGLEETVEKELMEEVGATIVDGTMERLANEPTFTSAGLTDEKIANYIAEVKPEFDQQKLEKEENILRAILPVSDLEKVLQGEKIEIAGIKDYSLDLKGLAAVSTIIERQRAIQKIKEAEGELSFEEIKEEIK